MMTPDDGTAQASTPGPLRVAEVMERATTTAEIDDHVAAAAYLMKHAGTTALVVLTAGTGGIAGILTDTDVANVVADGRDVNQVRIREVMKSEPAVIYRDASVREAAELMLARHVRQLPVVDDAGGVIGIFNIDAACRGLLGEGGR
jgi:CBS domain-containing protein